MKIFLLISTFALSALAQAQTYTCNLWKGGWDAENEVILTGDLNQQLSHSWKNSLGNYEVLVWKSVQQGDPTYPLGLIQIAFSKIKDDGGSTSVYMGQIYPQGKTEGSFWAEDLDKNNLITYRCFVK